MIAAKKRTALRSVMALAIVLMLAGGCTQTFRYYLPSASTGHVLGPPGVWTHGTIPHNYIYFDPPDFPGSFIFVNVRNGGLPSASLQIGIGFHRVDDKQKPEEARSSSQAPDEIEFNTRGSVAIYQAGNRRMAQFAFDKGGDGHFTLKNRGAISQSIPLPEAAAFQPLDVKLPTFTLNGRAFDVPTIHFESTEGDFEMGPP